MPDATAERRQSARFENRDGEPTYIRVRMGLLFPRTVLIPVQFVEANEDKRIFVVK